MRNARFLVPAILTPLLLIAGCPPKDVGDLTALTDTEKTNVKSAVQSAAGLTNAVGTTQALIAGDNSTAQTINAGTFGTCPVVTLSLNGLILSATADFGAGCTPKNSGFQCSGSADGTLNPLTFVANLTFNNLTCNSDTLGGTASLKISLSGQEADADGSADLDFTHSGKSYSASGDLTATYSRSTAQTTINSFDGTVSDGTNSADATMADLVISFATNGNFVPQSGTVTITSGARSIVITFSASTPSTGNVSVSINGSTPFVVNINSL